MTFLPGSSRILHRPFRAFLFGWIKIPVAEAAGYIMEPLWGLRIGKEIVINSGFFDRSGPIQYESFKNRYGPEQL